MFGRRRVDSNDSLPTTMEGTGGSPTNGFSMKRRSVDGSAKSIRMPIPAVQSWSRKSAGTKVTWYLCLFFIALGYYGYRHLRWSSGSVWLTCHQMDCHVQLTRANSWEKTVKLDMARRQFTAVYPVMATDEGAFVSANPDLNAGKWISDPIQRKKVQKQRNKELNYKGPDKNGNYLSYALIFTDKNADGGDDSSTNSTTNNNFEGQMADMNLRKMLPFSETTDTPGELRLIVRQFRIAQSKRRVRMMQTKIESYIRKRRQKLVLKETSSPSWQGLCSIIIGLIGFLITLLLGTFADEPDPFTQHHNKKKRRPPATAAELRKSNEPRKLDDSVYSQRQTPDQYEVSTKPAVKHHTNNRPRQRKTSSAHQSKTKSGTKSSAKSSSTTNNKTTRVRS